MRYQFQWATQRKAAGRTRFPLPVRMLMKSAWGISLISCCLILSPLIFAQEIPANLLQEDLRIMRQALEEGHGGIYRYTRKAEMDRTFDRAYQKIDHAMTDREFWRLL